MKSKKDVPDWVIEQMQEEEFLRSQLVVTHADYSNAVERLVGLAQQDTSGSLAAAQVLLSLYNGNNWHMNLTDLCLLDYQYLLSALVAIRGRTTLSEEPHNMINDGASIFSALEEQWQHLHTNRRYKQ